MTNILWIILNVSGGLLLGGFFYLGLYWTVKKGVSSKYPGFLFATSFFIRILVVLGGILFLTKGRMGAMVACLMGLLLSRTLVFIIDKTLSKPNHLNT